MGNANAASNNVLTITGTNSLLNVSGGVVFGNSSTAGASNLLLVADGGRLNSASMFIGRGTAASSAGSNNVVFVTGSNSVLTASTGVNDVRLGETVGGNQIVVSNGAQFIALGSGGAHIGYASSGNSALVAGGGSIWSNGATFTVGRGGPGNQLTISDGGLLVDTAGSLGTTAAGSNNFALVTGSGSAWSNTSTLIVGQAGVGNRLVIANSGKVYSAAATVGRADDNGVTVTDPGSLWRASSISIANPGVGNQLVISNGGTVIATSGGMSVGLDTAGEGSVLVTGNGSLLQIVGSTLNVGTNGISKGTGSILVTDGGTLEANTIADGFNNSASISNIGGIYQFTVATPTVTRRSANSVVLTNGTISFRGITNASLGVGSSPGVTNIAYHGNNTFMLNGSSNAVGLASYTFDSVANTGNPSNYQRLAMMNDGSLWRSANLTIGAGGALLASNATTTVAAVVTNLGEIKVVHSRMTFGSNVFISGRYVSDPSTNTFLADATIDPDGSLAGGVGDLFEFKRNLLIHSTNSGAFELHLSAVSFSGGVEHTNEITGADLGGTGAAHDAAFAWGTNFAYGELHLGSTADQVCFACGTTPLAASNALYVGWLDLLGSTNFVANLHSPTNINIYYAADETRNSYLGAATFQLLDCNGQPGGLLMPVIPEPSVLALLFATVPLIARRRSGCLGPHEYGDESGDTG